MRFLPLKTMKTKDVYEVAWDHGSCCVQCQTGTAAETDRGRGIVLQFLFVQHLITFAGFPPRCYLEPCYLTKTLCYTKIMAWSVSMSVSLSSLSEM